MLRSTSSRLKDLFVVKLILIARNQAVVIATRFLEKIEG